MNWSRGALGSLLAVALIVGAAGPAAAIEPVVNDDVSSISRPRPPEDGAVRGLVVAMRRATLSSRLQATILSIGPADGERFNAGDALVTFDCGSFEAELARASAEMEAARQTLAIKQDLAKSGSTSRLQATLATAELKRASATRTLAERQVAECVIRAPFDGRVVRRIANPFETVGYRDPLIEILSDHDLEVRLFVPSHWQTQLRPGADFGFRIDEIGRDVRLRIVALGAEIDNVSQLMQVRAAFATGDAELIAGMSGSARFGGIEP